jgi:hypothetical protein
MERGANPLPFFVWLRRDGAASDNAPTRHAPRARCDQRFFAPKPGGFMRILRSRVSLKADIRPGNAGGKRKETENEEENIYRRMRGLNCGKAELLPVELLPEERFAQLITADEGLGTAIAIEKILDFAILVDLLRGANRWTGENL